MVASLMKSAAAVAVPLEYIAGSPENNPNGRKIIISAWCSRCKRKVMVMRLEIAIREVDVPIFIFHSTWCAHS